MRGDAGRCGTESAGLNRHLVGDARALRERRSDSILALSLAAVREGDGRGGQEGVKKLSISSHRPDELTTHPSRNTVAVRGSGYFVPHLLSRISRRPNMGEESARNGSICRGCRPQPRRWGVTGCRLLCSWGYSRDKNPFSSQELHSALSEDIYCGVFIDRNFCLCADSEVETCAFSFA
jgi:hypothetical protein